MADTDLADVPLDELDMSDERKEVYRLLGAETLGDLWWIRITDATVCHPFGKVSRRLRYRPWDMELIAKFHPEDLLPAFCKGCGRTFSLDHRARQVLSQRGIEAPEDLKGMCLSMDGCPVCGEMIENPELRRIEDLAGG